MKGVKARRINVSRYSLAKPTANPPKKVATHWISSESFSPMPSWIFSMSLRQGVGKGEMEERGRGKLEDMY